ncbi:MAG: hypothetical protein P4N24_09875 [Acidobacteriota bacterium]|nr:hypothetical protein [Acidobacteriota bacterium]
MDSRGLVGQFCVILPSLLTKEFLLKPAQTSYMELFAGLGAMAPLALFATSGDGMY